MPDWGAGWANAARGVSDAFNMYAGSKIQERERIAEQARQLKEQKRQEMADLRKMGFQREQAEADRNMRLGLMKEEQAFRREESAADRQLRERQLEQNNAYNQGQLGLQARGLSLREQEMEMMASRPPGGGPKPMSESESQRALNEQFNAIADPESGLSDELRAMAAQFMNDPDATPAEKAEALRRLRANALIKPNVLR